MTRPRSPRQVAFEAMRAIADGAYANLDLPVRIRRAKLDARDAGFVTELVYGATRMRGLYDPIIAHGARRDLAAIDPVALDILRLGTHQLVAMRVPAHAAVDQSVTLARHVAGAAVSGFVNAVLHRVAERDLAGWREALTGGSRTDHALAVRYSHPEWVVCAFREALLGHGASTDQTLEADLEALLAADNAAAAVTLVTRPGLTTVDDLVRHGAQPAPLSPVGAVLASGGDPAAIRAVREARMGVQDIGSQLVTLALAAAPTRLGGEEAAWLDLCAGPGGKTALLAGLAWQRGLTVYANDVAEHRSRLVESAVRALVRAGARVMVGTGDGQSIGAEEPGRYDRVLVDAPCTGLGALRRRPEARWRRDPQDVPRLARLQAELVASALAATRPGGLVGYATCSPHLAETRGLVSRVLAGLEAEPDGPSVAADRGASGAPGAVRVEVLDAQPLFRDAAGDQIPDLGEPPFVQLWPHLHQTDAMFFALLRRTA